jgi:hypothetical protein
MNRQARNNKTEKTGEQASEKHKNVKNTGKHRERQHRNG